MQRIRIDKKKDSVKGIVKGRIKFELRGGEENKKLMGKFDGGNCG